MILIAAVAGLALALAIAALVLAYRAGQVAHATVKGLSLANRMIEAIAETSIHNANAIGHLQNGTEP